MAYEENVKYIGTFKSSADLSAAVNQFRPVKLASAAGQVALASAATDVVIGVLANKPKAGEVARIADVQAGGIGKVRIGVSQTIAVGDKLTANASGDAVKASSGNQVFALALEAVTTGAAERAVIAAKFVQMVA